MVGLDRYNCKDNRTFEEIINTSIIWRNQKQKPRKSVFGIAIISLYAVWLRWQSGGRRARDQRARRRRWVFESFLCMILLCIQILLTWLHWLVTHWQMVVGCVLLLLLLLLLLISWSGGRLTFLAISSAIFLCNSGLLNHFSFGDIKAGISTILSDSWSWL